MTVLGLLRKASLQKRLKGDETGLVGYWNFDDGSPIDRSVYGNHGTLHEGAKIRLVDLVLAGSNEPISAVLVRTLEKTGIKNRYRGSSRLWKNRLNSSTL